MRVLVTRPQPQAGVTAARLEALGHDPIILPMQGAVHDHAAAKDALASRYGAIAVTSAEAIRALSATVGPADADLRTTVFCVGTATAEAAENAGFKHVVVGPGTGAALADLIAASSAGLGNGLLYLAGSPRSPALEQGLQKAGVACRVAEVYRMVPVKYPPDVIGDLLQSKPPHAALFYSHEAAKLFVASLPPHAAEAGKGMRLLCLSQQVAEAIPAGLGPVSFAAAPREEALLALL